MTNLFDVSGKIALVTGSTGGIGLALARGLAEAGAAVVLNGRDKARLEAAAAPLKAAGLKIHMARFDVGAKSEIVPEIARIEAEIGPIDILINNAGMTRRVALEDFPEEAWHEIMRTNLDSVFLVSQAVVTSMLTRGRGKIVNICSVQSELGRASISPYAASKGGVKMLTKSMAVEWGRRGIQVNGIGPGYFKTELTKTLAADPAFTAWVSSRAPAGRWGEVEELVGAVIFLSSKASDFVNGHILMVDGGLTASV